MMGTEERLVYMANQIARNFAAMGDDAATAATADHIARFWEPRMRARILAGDPRQLGLDQHSRDGASVPVERAIAVETPVAVEFNGLGYAVVMATPVELIDFAY